MGAALVWFINDIELIRNAKVGELSGQNKDKL